MKKLVIALGIVAAIAVLVLGILALPKLFKKDKASEEAGTAVIVEDTDAEKAESTEAEPEAAVPAGNDGDPHVFVGAEVQASSFLPPDVPGTSQYEPAKAFDGDVTTAWNDNDDQNGSDGKGIGQWIEVRSDTPQTVKQVRILNGYAKNDDTYYGNHRPKDIRLCFSNGTEVASTLYDSKEWQTLTLPEPVTTTSVRIVVDSVYEGNGGAGNYDDMCITEIELYSRDIDETEAGDTVMTQEEAATAEETNPEEAFGSTLNMYCDFLSGQLSIFGTSIEPCISYEGSWADESGMFNGTCFRNDYSPITNYFTEARDRSLCYAFSDLNDDGIPELLITLRNGQWDTDSDAVMQTYALQGGTPQLISYSENRVKSGPGTTYDIVENSNGGAATETVIGYDLDPSGNLVEKIHLHSDWGDVFERDGTSISEDEFYAVWQEQLAYRSLGEFTWIDFADYYQRR